MKKAYIFFVLMAIIQLSNAQTLPVPDSVVTIFTKLPFTQSPRWVTASVYNEIAIIEGDIVLGNINDLTNPIEERSVYCDVCQLWPNSTIPYVIAPGFTPQMLNEINIAITQINNTTNLCVVPRTNQADYVKFVSFPACYSQVGRVGGEQVIQLNDVGDDNIGCFKKEIIHEIFHAAGLWLI